MGAPTIYFRIPVDRSGTLGDQLGTNQQLLLQMPHLLRFHKSRMGVTFVLPLTSLLSNKLAVTVQACTSRYEIRSKTLIVWPRLR